jgi:hypothetical protein
MVQEDERTGSKKDHCRFFPENTQLPSRWPTHDQENGSDEYPVHVPLPFELDLGRALRSGQASNDTNIPRRPIPPLIIAGSWR